MEKPRFRVRYLGGNLEQCHRKWPSVHPASIVRFTPQGVYECLNARFGKWAQ